MYVLGLQAIFTLKCCLSIQSLSLANLLEQLLLKLPKNHQAVKGEVMVLWVLSVDVMTSSASKLPSGLNLLASISRSTPRKKAFPEIVKCIYCRPSKDTQVSTLESSLKIRPSPSPCHQVAPIEAPRHQRH